MKLNVEQIAKIDVLLEKNRIKYLDIKFELIDHIASEVEAEIEVNSISFNEALSLVFGRWKPMFSYSKSFYTGQIHTFPKIVLDKMVANIKKHFIVTILFSILGLIPTFLFKSEFILVLKPFNLLINILIISLSVFILSIVFLVNFKRKFTTFSFLINQSATILIAFVFVLPLDEEVINLKLFDLFLFLIQTVVIINYFIMHRQFVNKYKILWN